MAFRFVHAADIHLDSPLSSLALRDPDLAHLIGNATRRAFVGIVDLCLAEQVDALLLAGDLYDGDQTSMKTARFLGEQVRRLSEANVRVFIIRGNHDALSRITKELTFPDSVKVIGGRAEAIIVEGSHFPIAVHGLSFAQPHAPDSLLARYKPPVEGAVNIGLMHTSLAGAPGHDLYAPCSLAELQAAGFRYWALGHVHKRSVVDGNCTIVMPGMPQGRDINEAGAKSVSLVTISDDRSIQVEERYTAVAQFERISLNTSGIDDWRDLLGAISRTMEGARGDIAAEHLVARLHLTGRTPLFWRLRRDLDLLKTDIDHRASVIGGTWIEKIAIDCESHGAAEVSSDVPIMELRRLIDEEVIQSDSFQAEMTEIVEELRAQLPAECRHLLGTDESAFKAAIAALAKDGADDVLARIQAVSQGEAV